MVSVITNNKQRRRPITATSAADLAAYFGRYIGAALLYVCFVTNKGKTPNNARNGGQMAALVVQ